MKAIALRGESLAARENLAQYICRELTRRRFGVAYWRNQQTGQGLEQNLTVLASGGGYSQITWPKRRSLEDYLPYLHEDFLIIDHPYDNLPNIALSAGRGVEADKFTLACVGEAKIAENWPFFHIKEQLPELLDFMVEQTPDLLPFPDGNPCCKACGRKDCAEMLVDIMQKKATPQACKLRKQIVEVKINGHDLPMVRFVQDIIRANSLGVLSTLNGYEKNSLLEIIIDDRGIDD